MTDKKDDYGYRDAIRDIDRELRWTFSRFIITAVIIVTVTGIIGFGLDSLGLFGKTIMERKVFENSYQRTEGLKTQLYTDESALAQIDTTLASTQLDESTRNNLEAQRNAIKLRINITKERLR